MTKYFENFVFRKLVYFYKDMTIMLNQNDICRYVVVGVNENEGHHSSVFFKR